MHRYLSKEGVISLSAILLGDNYFDALPHVRRVIDDISLVYERILIPIKARAFLDLAQRRADGESVDARHIRKQRADVFRLTQLLPGEGSRALADSMRADLGQFLGQALGDPGFDYAALRLPFTLDDATAILGRYYRLDSFRLSGMSETPGSEARPYTETSALVEILNWSRQRPAWMRDALRRLLVGGELSTQDIDELEAICLGDDGEGSPLSAEHIAPRRLVGKPVSITGLRDLVGVNALASGQGLTFATGGLSIVYGDNGSGKSGFVRVLKSACRSRDDKTAILQDVNAPGDVPQRAHIDFEVAGTADTYEWRPEHGDHADLPAVSIFDARSANTHVQKTNNVAYVPFAMALLDRLGRACDELRVRVKGRIDTLAAQTPVVIRTPSLNRGHRRRRLPSWPVREVQSCRAGLARHARLRG